MPSIAAYLRTYLFNSSSDEGGIEDKVFKRLISNIQKNLMLLETLKLDFGRYNKFYTLDLPYSHNSECSLLIIFHGLFLYRCFQTKQGALNDVKTKLKNCDVWIGGYKI